MIMHAVVNYVYRDTLLLFLSVNTIFFVTYIYYRADDRLLNYLIRVYQDVKSKLAKDQNVKIENSGAAKENGGVNADTGKDGKEKVD